MNKTFNTRINRWEIDAAEGYILHRIGSDDYTEIHHASVTADDLDSWEEIAVDAVPRYTKAQYRAQVVALIRERYDINKEMEIQREMLNALINPAPMSIDDTDSGTTDIVVEFNAYNDYVEECKRRAKELLMEKGGETDDRRS